MTAIRAAAAAAEAATGTRTQVPGGSTRIGGNLMGATVHLVACLTELGHPPGFAARIAGLLGVLSVTGRLATTATTRRLTRTTTITIVFVIQAGAVSLLPIVGHARPGAIACVLGFGLGFGVATIARPAILANRYGTTGYATIASFLTVPLTIAKALTPLIAAAIRDSTGTYTGIALGTGGLSLVAATALLSVRHLDHRPTQSP